MGDKWHKLKKPKLKEGVNIAAPSKPSSFSSFDYPIFCLKYLHKGEFGVDNCEDASLASLFKRMYKLSQLTWQQISTAHRHGFGWEKISQDSIKAGKPANITPDTNFYAFRFDGLAPIVGYRNDVIFHVLYIDSKFSLYSH